MLRIKIVDLFDTISRLMIGKVVILICIKFINKKISTRKKEIIDGGLWVQFYLMRFFHLSFKFCINLCF